MSYEIEVYSPSGALRRVLSPEDPVDSVRWAVRGDGDCLEAEIVGRGLDLRARDIIAIRAGVTPGFPSRPRRYWGCVTQHYDQHSTGLTPTLIIGGRKRLTEILVRNRVLGDDNPLGADVAALARAAAMNATARPLLTAPLGNFTNTGFTLGYRLPHLETVAEALDALEAAAPGFTVEPSSSYTYGSVTYTPGEVVPPARWGVRAAFDPMIAEPQIFFQRDLQSLQVLDEIADKLTIVYDAYSSEDTVDDVTVLLFDDHNAETWTKNPGVIFGHPVHTPEPVAYRRARGTSYGAERLVPIPPLDGLKKAPISGSPLVNVNWADASNAYDNDLTSYASNTQGFVSILELALPPLTQAIRIRYSAHEEVRVSYFHSYQGGFPTYSVIARLPTTNGRQRDHLLLLPTQPPTLTCGKTITLTTPVRAHDGEEISADVVRIYDIAPQELDEATLRRIAESHWNIPRTTAAVVSVPGVLVPTSSSWGIDLARGGRLSGTAELIEYSITREQGFTSKIHLNQALTGGETSRRALLDANIRSAVMQGRRLVP